jgi:hypothetical protein
MRRLAKTKMPHRYLIETSTKSLCQLSDSVVSGLLEFADFALFCVSFSDNLVTVKGFNLSRT